MSEHIEDLGEYLYLGNQEYDDNRDLYLHYKEVPFRGAATGPFSAPRVYQFWTEVRRDWTDEDGEDHDYYIDQRWEVTFRERSD